MIQTDNTSWTLRGSLDVDPEIWQQAKTRMDERATLMYLRIRRLKR